jgi:hypothetical protein
MCDRCETIERQLLNYRDAHSSADDALAISLLAAVIEDLETERLGLHPADGRDEPWASGKSSNSPAALPDRRSGDKRAPTPYSRFPLSPRKPCIRSY